MANTVSSGKILMLLLVFCLLFISRFVICFCKISTQVVTILQGFDYGILLTIYLRKHTRDVYAYLIVYAIYLIVIATL